MIADQIGDDGLIADDEVRRELADALAELSRAARHAEPAGTS